MSSIEAISWLGAFGFSGFLSLQAWQQRPPTDFGPQPQSIARAPTTDEIQTVQARAQTIQTAIQNARNHTGTAIAIGQLESNLSNGQPILPNGLPDNPLFPGVGSVGFACSRPGAAVDQHLNDWLYCPETGVFEANLP